MQLSICSSKKAAETATALARRLQTNLGVETLLIQEDSAPVSETWEEGAAAHAVLVLLDSTSAPAPFNRDDWTSLLAHDGHPPIAFVRLENCAYPKLLERRPFFPITDPTPWQRAVESWLTAMLPRANAASIAPFAAEFPDTWWHDLVDRPGQAETADSAAAHAFAHLASPHFQGVEWIGCAGLEPALIRARVESRTQPGRRLFVLAHLEKPIRIPESRDSFLHLAGLPPEADGDPILGACYAPAFPGWFATALGADLSSAIPLDPAADLFRLDHTPRTTVSIRHRHLHLLHRYFTAWNHNPGPCRALLAEVPAAIAHGFASDWTRGCELARRSAFVLLGAGRRREGIRRLHHLLVEAEEYGDTETAADAKNELSWLTNEDGPARYPSSSGPRVQLSLFGGFDAD